MTREDEVDSDLLTGLHEMGGQVEVGSLEDLIIVLNMRQGTNKCQLRKSLQRLKRTSNVSVLELCEGRYRVSLLERFAIAA